MSRIQELREKYGNTLKAIQEFKAESYVGTQEAFKGLAYIKEIYDTPERIAQEINRKVSQVIPVTYPATPERITGLQQIFVVARRAAFSGTKSSYRSSYRIGDFTDIDLTYIDSIIDSTKVMMDLEEQVLGFPDRELDDGQLYYSFEHYSKNWYDFFLNANEHKVQSDADFGVKVTDCLLKRSEAFRTQYTEKFRNIILHYMIHTLLSLADQSWSFAMSKKTHAIREGRLVTGSKVGMVRLTSLVNRIYRDQVDHRLEYRQKVLNLYLAQCNFTDWNDVVEYTREQLKERRGIEELMKKDGIREPKDMFQVPTLEFVLRILGSERNFVNRYLKN